MQVSNLKIGQEYIYEDPNNLIPPFKIVYVGNLNELIKDRLFDQPPFTQPLLFLQRDASGFRISELNLRFLSEPREMGSEFWVVYVKNRAPQNVTADEITNLFTLDATLHQDKQSALDELNRSDPEKRLFSGVQKFKCIPVEE